MKVGSLVVIKPIPNIRTDAKILWLPIMDEQTIYTVRELFEGNKYIIVRLEEGIIGYDPYQSIELGIEQEFVKEIQPPMDVKSIVEECMFQTI